MDLITWMPLETLTSGETAKSGYAEELGSLTQVVAKKFTRYANHLKILLVQFYGESSDLLSDEDIKGIVLSAQMPEMIDQVWVAREEWVGEYEYDIAWDRVR